MSVAEHNRSRVLEEAREDETVLASLSTELEHARANSSRLLNQLATAMNSTNHENGYCAENATVSKSDRQTTTMEGFKGADTEIQLRDNQIQQLKEKIRSMEDQIGRTAEQLGRLQSERSDLQAENSIVLRENRDLLEQLSSRDNKMVKQVEEMRRLKSLAARLVEQQKSRQHQIDSMAAERCPEANTLQEHLQQAIGANFSKEVSRQCTVCSVGWSVVQGRDNSDLFVNSRNSPYTCHRLIPGMKGGRVGNVCGALQPFEQWKGFPAVATSGSCEAGRSCFYPCRGESSVLMA